VGTESFPLKLFDSMSIYSDVHDHYLDVYVKQLDAKSANVMFNREHGFRGAIPFPITQIVVQLRSSLLNRTLEFVARSVVTTTDDWQGMVIIDILGGSFRVV
jgi:hypothetical protein